MKTHIRLATIILATLPAALFASSSTDRKIEDAAQASYNYRTVLQDQVKVKSNDGVVTLTGTVQDKYDRSLAADTVSNLPGVVSVDNEIQVSSDVPEHSDAWIALKVHGLLLVKANVSASSTKVDVKDGVVTLSGTAESQAQKDLTEAYVKDVDNVKSVTNNLVVQVPVPGPTASAVVDDASITAQVKYQLLTHSSTSALSTKVTTNSGVVSIGGTADNDAEKDLVTRLAQDTRGVQSVVNNMTVKSSS